jgi:hypothetical protein
MIFRRPQIIAKILPRGHLPRAPWIARRRRNDFRHLLSPSAPGTAVDIYRENKKAETAFDFTPGKLS